MVAVAVPITVLLNVPPVSTNWTLLMVAHWPHWPTASSAEAVPLTVALFEGTITAVVGGVLLTVTVIPALYAVFPTLSVARLCTV